VRRASTSEPKQLGELYHKASVLKQRQTKRPGIPALAVDDKPHEKSMTLGWLATFLAVIPTWEAFIAVGVRELCRA
jgi:hypothetical protein